MSGDPEPERQLLLEGLRELGLRASGEQVEALLRLARLVERWGRRINLSGHRSLESVVRPHEAAADDGRCFLEQGLLCLGPATRGGCGQACIRVNMPCRGCYGPTPGALDPGAEAISAIGSVLGVDTQTTPAHVFKTLVRSVRDPAGTFYRFTLPSAILSRVVDDRRSEES